MRRCARQGMAPPRGWNEIEIAGRSASGRAQKLRLAGGFGDDFLISASSFRYAVSRSLGWNKIRSELFEVRTEGDRAVFFGRGAGHGVGMCQTGAEEMAIEGKDYRQILGILLSRNATREAGHSNGTVAETLERAFRTGIDSPGARHRDFANRRKTSGRRRKRSRLECTVPRATENFPHHGRLSRSNRPTRLGRRQHARPRDPSAAARDAEKQRRSRIHAAPRIAPSADRRKSPRRHAGLVSRRTRPLSFERAGRSRTEQTQPPQTR